MQYGNSLCCFNCTYFMHVVFRPTDKFITVSASQTVAQKVYQKVYDTYIIVRTRLLSEINYIYIEKGFFLLFLFKIFTNDISSNTDNTLITSDTGLQCICPSHSSISGLFFFPLFSVIDPNIASPILSPLLHTTTLLVSCHWLLLSE